MAGQRRPYRGVHRGEGNAEEESKTQERVLEDYVKYVAKNTEIFSTHSADELLDSILDYVEKMGYKHKLVDN